MLCRTPGQPEPVLVSWCLLATRCLTGSRFWTGSLGVGQERKGHSPVHWQGLGEEDQGGPSPPIHLRFQEGTQEMEMGVGSRMGREEGVKWAGVSTHQTILLSPLPVPATTHQPRLAAWHPVVTSHVPFPSQLAALVVSTTHISSH